MTRLVGGLVLALLSAAAINLGFLFQHRALRHPATAGGLRGVMLEAVRSPAWLGGQVLGWAGFGVQIVAISLAPLSLVQSFAAGGLVLSVPLAARWFGHRISTHQVLAIALATAGLVVLPIAVPTGADHLQAARLILAAIVLTVVGVAAGVARGAAPRAAAAGLLYGVADAAIKAASVSLQSGLGPTRVCAWAAVATLATFGGFLAFQSALRAGDALTAISLMTILTALVALGFGWFAFHESLGANGAVLLLHLAAIALILSCVPALTSAQTAIAHESSGNRTVPGEASRHAPAPR